MKSELGVHQPAQSSMEWQVTGDGWIILRIQLCWPDLYQQAKAALPGLPVVSVLHISITIIVERLMLYRYAHAWISKLYLFLIKGYENILGGLPTIPL